MQHPSTEASFAPMSGAAAAYGAVIRYTESTRDIEYRVFETVTAALEAAREPGGSFVQKIKALNDNRNLWQALAYDVADGGNPLPDDLRARLISLAIWVSRETDHAMRPGAQSYDPTGMIDVNRSIMRGLLRGQEDMPCL